MKLIFFLTPASVVKGTLQRGLFPVESLSLVVFEDGLLQLAFSEVKVALFRRIENVVYRQESDWFLSKAVTMPFEPSQSHTQAVRHTQRLLGKMSTELPRGHFRALNG